jgi:NAD(P)-dependent dehydrogenase (short-subunit alcohol dehydrogenase family)
MTRAEQGKGAVIVTGASRGIGAAIAEKLADDGYGVVVNYAADAEGAESVVSTIRARGGRAVAVRADVAAPGDVADLFDRAQQEMGPLAALVNNAGTTGEQARIDQQDADHLARLMQINVVGPMVCAKHAVQAMSTAHGGNGGSIVNIASIGARPVERGRPGRDPRQQRLARRYRHGHGGGDPRSDGGRREQPDRSRGPARRDRRRRVVAGLAGGIVRHRQRYHRVRRPLTGAHRPRRTMPPGPLGGPPTWGSGRALRP